MQLGTLLLGDLGNAAVDGRILTAVLLRGGAVAQWLENQGVGLDDVKAAFPDSEW